MKVSTNIQADRKMLHDVGSEVAGAKVSRADEVAATAAVAETAASAPTQSADNDAFLTLGRAAPRGLVSNPGRILSRLYDFLSGAKPVEMAAMPGVRRAEPRVQVSPEEAYAARGAKLAEEFPSLAFYVKDMRAYIDDKRAEFQAVKKLHPENPYDHLEFFEAAKPFIDDSIPTIGPRIEEYTDELIELRMAGKGDSQRAQDLELGITFLTEVKEKMESVLDDGSLSYMATQALAHHYTSAMDLNQWNHNLSEKMHFALDASWQGYERTPVQQDYEEFKAGEFKLFEGKASSVATIKAASDPFKEAFFNPDELEVIRIPTQAEINEEILLDSLADRVQLTGTVGTLLHADGVARPPKAFEHHDDRHSSLIFVSEMDYQRENGIEGPKVIEAQDLSANFKDELLHALDVLKESDPQLAGAVYFFFFNYHHERARTIMPSSYIEAGAYTHHAYGKFVLKKRAGEKMQFDAGYLEGFKLMKLAQQYIREFMLVPQGGNPPRIVKEDALINFAERNGGPRDYEALAAKVLSEREH